MSSENGEDGASVGLVVQDQDEGDDRRDDDDDGGCQDPEPKFSDRLVHEGHFVEAENSSSNP